MELVPFDDRDGFIWYNGAMLDWRKAKIHVLNHGLHYASCVFEGERVYNGKIFKLTEHSQRLHDSAELLGFKIPGTVAELDRITNEVVAANGIENGYVRPFAWRGSEMMAVSAQKAKIHLAVAAWSWPSYFSNEAKQRGLRLQTARWRRPAPDTAPTASKAAGLYMICTLSKHAAEQAGFEDALMLDYRGLVAEATGANIFMVMGDELHTPTPDCFLNGITRQTIIELARARGIKVVERHIKPAELTNASEIFICGTAAEISPIGRIDGHNFSVGAITRQLAEDYSNLVRQ